MPLPIDRVRRILDLPREDIEWFTNEYGSSVSLTWLVTYLVKAFRAAHVHTKTPKQLWIEAGEDAYKTLNHDSLDLDSEEEKNDS